jgi:predicted RNA-binding Zn-ribbon protein involved in translation (DUF1610 family)
MKVVDASCKCDRCELRTQDFYEVNWACRNCDERFRVRSRKGDEVPLGATCPNCGVRGGTQLRRQVKHEAS